MDPIGCDQAPGTLRRATGHDQGPEIDGLGKAPQGFAHGRNQIGLFIQSCADFEHQTQFFKPAPGARQQAGVFQSQGHAIGDRPHALDVFAREGIRGFAHDIDETVGPATGPQGDSEIGADPGHLRVQGPLRQFLRLVLIDRLAQVEHARKCWMDFDRHCQGLQPGSQPALAVTIMADHAGDAVIDEHHRRSRHLAAAPNYRENRLQSGAEILRTGDGGDDLAERFSKLTLLRGGLHCNLALRRGQVQVTGAFLDPTLQLEMSQSQFLQHPCQFALIDQGAGHHQHRQQQDRQEHPSPDRLAGLRHQDDRRRGDKQGDQQRYDLRHLLDLIRPLSGIRAG